MMNGQPAATSAIWVERAGLRLVDEGELLDAGPRGLDLVGHARRRLVAAAPGLLVGHDETVRRVGLEDLARDPDLALRRAQLPRGAGGPVGVDGRAVPVAGREVGLGERAPDGLGRRADEGGEDVARGGRGRRGGSGAAESGDVIGSISRMVLRSVRRSAARIAKRSSHRSWIRRIGTGLR